MSLASEAILAVEEKVKNRLEMHKEAVLALGQEVDRTLADAEKASRESLLAYETVKANELAEEIEREKHRSDEVTNGVIAQVKEQVTSKEELLVGQIVEEVCRRYGGF